MRGESPEAIARKMFEQTSIGGLQGPTISAVVAREELRSEGQMVRGQHHCAARRNLLRRQRAAAHRRQRRHRHPMCTTSLKRSRLRYKAMLAALEE